MLFPPPYTYNDPRLLYNEPCFFYDGGFDDICLLNKFSIKRQGRSSFNGKKPKQIDDKEEKKEFLNIFIECQLKEVNEEECITDDKPIWTRFVGSNDDIDVSINNINVSLSKPVIKGEYLNLMKKLFISTSFEGTKVKNDLEGIDVDVKVNYIEPYEKIKVSTTLLNIKSNKDKE